MNTILNQNEEWLFDITTIMVSGMSYMYICTHQMSLLMNWEITGFDAQHTTSTKTQHVLWNSKAIE